MLTLEPPHYEVGGIVVYRDHAVPNQFYYAAPPPAFARADGRPMFDVMAYAVALEHSVLRGTSIPDELGAGFLTMGVECVMSEAQRARVLQAIEELAGMPRDQLALLPIPYHRGSASLIALDQYASPGEEQPFSPGAPIEGRPTFVETVLGSGKPSLLGNLRTIFSVRLSQEGVAFLQGLYESGAAPVGVVYDLKFYGLRPSVEARVTADLRRIHEHFGGGLGVKCRWFKAEIQAALEYLETQGAVNIEITSQAVGDEAQKTKELALSLFRDRIIQELFHPTAPSQGPDASAIASAIREVTGTAGGASGGGSSSSFELSLALNYRRTEELGTFTYDFSERAPEERTHAPQGFLPALLSAPELERSVHLIPLDHSFFELLEVLVTGPTPEEFASLGIRQVEAVLTYGTSEDLVEPESRTLIFRPDDTGDKVFAARRRGRGSLAYSCALTYEFERAGGIDSDSFRYVLPPRVHTGRTLLINPYADFGVLSVEVQHGRIHQDVSEIDLALEYRSEESGYRALENFRLKPSDPADREVRRRWTVRTLETGIAHYTATCSFVFRDGTTYQAPPRASTDPLFRVDTPFVANRDLMIRPNPISPEVNQITVELEYEDEANDYRRRSRVELKPPFESVVQSWPILDYDRQKVRYRVTVHEPGLLSEGLWEETDDPSIVVGDVAHRVAKVQVRLIGSSLEDAGLDAVLVQIGLVDQVGPLRDPAYILFEPGQAAETVDLTLVPGAALRYRYKTAAFAKDGTTRESEWRESSSPILVIQVQTL